MGMDDIYRFVDYFFAAQPSKRGNPLQKFFFFSPMSRARPGTGLVPWLRWDQSVADDWSAGGIAKAAVLPDQRVFWFFGLADLGGQSEDATKE